MRPGGRAWVALWTGVAIWDVIAPPDEMLTDAARRGMAAHPVLTAGAIAITALHLADVLPPRADPFHLLGVLLTRLSTSGHRLVNYRGIVGVTV